MNDDDERSWTLYYGNGVVVEQGIFLLASHEDGHVGNYQELSCKASTATSFEREPADGNQTRLKLGLGF